mmetsp:Transcript_12753/g.23755  ORF Transcript_12753/g.23755 Transcript_12753/m.23755 type:complete len:371 (+) Transcript_12753:57-1169(+)
MKSADPAQLAFIESELIQGYLALVQSVKEIVEEKSYRLPAGAKVNDQALEGLTLIKHNLEELKLLTGLYPSEANYIEQEILSCVEYLPVKLAAGSSLDEAAREELERLDAAKIRLVDYATKLIGRRDSYMDKIRVKVNYIQIIDVLLERFRSVGCRVVIDHVQNIGSTGYEYAWCRIGNNIIFRNCFKPHQYFKSLDLTREFARVKLDIRLDLNYIMKLHTNQRTIIAMKLESQKYHAHIYSLDNKAWVKVGPLPYLEVGPVECAVFKDCFYVFQFEKPVIELDLVSKACRTIEFPSLVVGQYPVILTENTSQFYYISGRTVLALDPATVSTTKVAELRKNCYSGFMWEGHLIYKSPRLESSIGVELIEF